MQDLKTKLGESGNVSIPPDYWHQLGIQPGDEIILRLEAGELRILSSQAAIRRAQQLIRQYISPERQLSTELIQDRREEAQRE
ncbi:MAG: hypothetical protein ACTS2F_30650 [Thainema sp.]